MRAKFDPFLLEVEVAFLHEIGEFQVLDRDNPPVITWTTCNICGGNDEHWGTLNGYQFAVKARQQGYSNKEVQDVLNKYWANLPKMVDLHYIDLESLWLTNKNTFDIIVL